MDILYKLIKDIIVGIISKTVTYLFKEKKSSVVQNPIMETQSNIEESIRDINIEVPKTHSYAIALGKRLSESMEMLNSDYSKKSLSKICDYINYPSVSELEKYFSGEVEAPREFILKYADNFGLNYNWLRHHEGSPIKLHEFYATRAYEYYEIILNLKPSTIFYVRSESKRGESGIVLKLDEHKYIVFPATFNISSFVGGIGRKQIISFYELIKALKNHFSFLRNFGLILPEEEFDDLFTGKVYPTKAFECKTLCLHWWDDLLDYDHKYPISQDYERMYGIEFINAQEIIRNHFRRKSA